MNNENMGVNPCIQQFAEYYDHVYGVIVSNRHSAARVIMTTIYHVLLLQDD
jgi:hypothetical protein